MSSPRPIEIVGGGLAGLSLGLALRRAHVPVTVYEAGDYPRHRVCGEFITGLRAATIDRLGLAPLLRDAVVHRDVAWFIGESLTSIHTLPEPALGLSRYGLDTRLARAFEAAGGELHRRTRLPSATQRIGRVFAHGRRRGPPRWLGLKVHARDLELVRGLELHLGDECYVGLAQVEHGTVNICGLFRRRPISRRGPRLLLEYLSACGLSALRARLERATIDEASFSAVAALAFDRRTSAGSRIQIGDACAMIPPFTGNGMAMAFQSAEAVLDPLLAFSRGEAGWNATCRATNAALRGRFRVRLTSAHALHSFLLQPNRQRWLAPLSRARLLPFRALYSALH